jgi:uncharacterized protein (TIGR03118 family)
LTFSIQISCTATCLITFTLFTYKTKEMKRKLVKSSLLYLPLLIVLGSCQKSMDTSPLGSSEQVSADAANKELHPKDLKDFDVVALVGDNNDFHPLHTDPTLINAWGVVFPTSGPAWLTSFGGNQSFVFNADGTSARPPVTIPSHASTTGGHPTGIMFNTTSDFKLPNGNSARFIFAEADGIISGWNGGNAAIKMADDSSGEVYLGLALASFNGNNFLYAANFAQGKIDVYDKTFTKVSLPFTDPYLPRGYTPLNVQNIDGKLYVMYGQPGTGDDVISHRNGFIDIFNPDGTFVKRFASQGQLNAPWGITKAPKGFWGDVAVTEDVFLVGNFGDGRINAFTAEGTSLGQLREHGKPIEIEGLWGLAFAPATSISADHNTLFFAAGPGKEQHGLFGSIKK